MATSDGDCGSSYKFLAIRMRDVTEFDGAVAHLLAQKVTDKTSLLEKVKNSCTSLRRSTLLRGIRRLSGKELLNCLMSSSLKRDDSGE